MPKAKIRDRIEPIEAPKTLQKAVADRLREAIVHGRLKPGERIDQTELAEWFQVSRVPIREALRTLVAEGLVSYYSHRGAEVTALSSEEAREICEIRLTLETMALRYAIKNMTPDLRRELEAILVRMDEEVTDPVAWAGFNHQFHALLYRASGRARLCNIIETLRNSVRAYVVADMSDLERCRIAGEEHRQLLELACQGEVAAAEQLLRQHLVRAGNRVASRIREASAGRSGD